jgi:hypothetical protein
MSETSQAITETSPPAPAWTKSSLSFANGNCVEVSSLDGTVLMRDSKNRDGGVLRYTRAQWAALLDEVRADRLSAAGNQVVNCYAPGDDPENGNPVLRFTPDEWHAFIGGVRNGEFDRFGGASPEVTS